MQKGDIVKTKIKDEVYKYMECLKRKGDIKNCLNLYIALSENDMWRECLGYEIYCKEDSLSKFDADNVTKINGNQPLYKWPKCNEKCHYYVGNNGVNRAKLQCNKIFENILELLKKEPGKVKWIHIGLVFLAGEFVGEFGTLRILFYQVVEYLKKFGLFN